MYGEFILWRQRNASVKMLLVEGNHDLKSGPLTGETNILEVSERYCMAPFSLCHYPQVTTNGYGLAGHIHPSVILEGKARQELRLPCFWFGADYGVLPAFGQFTGCAPILPKDGDTVLVIADGNIVPVA